MADEDHFQSVVARAVRACSLSSIDSIITAADDTSLVAHGFDELGFDSLAYMEFCVSVHLETGIELDVGRVQLLGTPLRVAEYLQSRQ